MANQKISRKHSNKGQPNLLWERVGKEIRRIREGRGETLNQFALDVDLNPGNLSRLERGIQGVSMDTLSKIATRLDVPMSQILAVAEGAIIPLQSGESTLPLVPMGKVADVVKEIRKGSTAMDIAGCLRLPLASGSELSERNDFVLDLQGAAARAMAPTYHVGDQAVISLTTQPEPGDHVVALLKDRKEAVFRVYRPKGDGSIELAALHPDWPSIIIDDNNPGEVIGVMIERRHIRRLD